MVMSLAEPQATPAQRAKLRQFGYEIDKHDSMSMHEASAKIEKAILDSVEIPDFEINDSVSPFTEAHVTIVEGSQRGGKTVTVVGKVKDRHDKECVKIYCEEVLHITNVIVKAYDRKTRIAKIRHEGKIKLFRISETYKLHTPMRIFSNIHLFGLPYRYIPSFRHLLYYLKKGIIRNGVLIIDEAHKGMNARAGMTTLGQELEKQGFEMGKMQLDVFIITHMPRLIDWALRTIPTEHISCSYNKSTYKVTCQIRKKGEAGTRDISFDARQYWGNYWTNEKINA
jgi:hypothetical protein